MTPLRGDPGRAREVPEGSRSATLEALRLAQEEHGWLSPDALREVAEALDVTPAYCKAVAHVLRHVPPRAGRDAPRRGVHQLSCALSGAQRVVGGFESELGVAPGNTTEDGEVTFRTVECLGGCGYATVVAVDHRYRQFVGPDDVAAIVEELRAGT